MAGYALGFHINAFAFGIIVEEQDMSLLGCIINFHERYNSLDIFGFKRQFCFSSHYLASTSKRVFVLSLVGLILIGFIHDRFVYDWRVH
jgi:hypothetical protein